MKRIKLYLTVLCILLTGTVFATHTSFQERTESWLQRSNSSSSSSESDTPPGEPNGTDWAAPIGDALPLIFGFSLIYLAVKCPSFRCSLQSEDSSHSSFS